MKKSLGIYVNNFILKLFLKYYKYKVSQDKDETETYKFEDRNRVNFYSHLCDYRLYASMEQI